MALAASLEVSCKLSGFAAIFLFVHSPSDEWKVIAFQSLAPVVMSVVGIWMAYRLASFRVPTLAMIREAVRRGWPMFLLRSGIATYSTANVVILALFAPRKCRGVLRRRRKAFKGGTLDY